MDPIIDSFHEADVSSYFSHLSHEIQKYASDLLNRTDYIVVKELFLSIREPLESMFSFYDLEFCDIYSLSFIAIISSYKKNGTYLDVLRVLNKGSNIDHVPNSYIYEEKPSIGMVCKLFGLTKIRDMKKMDCPRVWDLEKDEVVDNPNFRDGPIHQIVAITHRWQSDEITYKHLMKLEQINVILKELGKEPKPNKISLMADKLAKIREELKVQDIRYVWMDTLCIDKTSSVELDMSIRSMFRWYSNAAFVYLEYYTDFDEWGTRGWTLQEGHAANSLVVSPKHGNSFMELVSNMHEYDVYKLALDRVPEQSLSAYWTCLMNLRKTTVTEDKAYALVGVLNISFQFAYGEGEMSFSRLAEEITKQKGDVSWFISNFAELKHIFNMQETYIPRYDNIIPVTNQGITLSLDTGKNTRHEIIGHCMFVKLSNNMICSMGLEYGEVNITGSYGVLYIYPPYVFNGSPKYKVRKLG